jgi:hypothetical protein
VFDDDDDGDEGDGDDDEEGVVEARSEAALM